MKKFLFILTLIFISISAFCQLTIEYIDGYLDLKDGDEWIELDWGDVVTDNDIIKLDEYSTAVLKSRAVNITIARAGEYRVGDLIVASNNRMSLISSIGSRINSIVKEEETIVRTTAGGVRASNAQEELGKINWAVETSDILLEDGIAVFEMGDFDYAIVLFEDAAYLAKEEESIEILQYAYLLIGICWAQVDDIEYANEYFQKTIDLDDTTENASLAIELMEELNGN